MSSEKKEDTDNESLTSREESWSNDIELVLTNVLDNTKRLQLIHKNNYLILRHYLFLIRLPIIVLSSINSVLSVGLSSFVNQSITSSTNCIISLICGILGSLELFIGIQSKSDKEFETYQNLKLLAIKISHTLKLEPAHREQSGSIFLKEVMGQYHTIFENSLVNPAEIDDELLTFRIKTDNALLRFDSPRMKQNNINATL